MAEFLCVCLQVDGVRTLFFDLQTEALSTLPITDMGGEPTKWTPKKEARLC